MGSIGNPKSWAPYLKNKDCSQGFCSLYCPQWCYIIFPPPPSSDFSHVDHHSSSSRPIFSPLVIAIIGILASALLLVSYYSIISKYCGNPNSSSSRRENDYLDGNEESEENNIQNPNLHEPWHVISTGGLDEALIKSITTCKYKKGDGLIIDGSDCSVCLSEFEDDESIRLLPKCSHAFHVHCIDTWLKSHSNCPVCRANIICSTPAPPPLTEISMNIGNNVTVEASMTSEASSNAEIHDDQERENTNLSRTLQDTVIHITDELGYQGMRRSFSMDHYSYQNHVSIADILRMDNQDKEENYCSASSQGSSKHNSTEEISKNRDRKQVVTINRSFSSGRLFLSRQGRVRNTIIPL